MYLAPDSKNKPDSTVRDVQSMLNVIRLNYHHNWNYLKEDGCYGPKTAEAVKAFQIWRNISIQTSANGPILGDYTLKCIRECYRSVPNLTNKQSKTASVTSYKENAAEAYNIGSTITKGYYGISENVNSFADFLAKTEEVIIQQSNNLQRRISKIPNNTRPRHLIKALNKSKEFIKTAKKAGVNSASKITYGSLSKNDIIKYLQECSDVLVSSSMTKFFTNAKNVLIKIKNALKPLYDLLNKIPGIKYLGAIEKLVRGTWSMINGEFENALKLYMDAIREIIESFIVDAAIVAAFAAGGWIALVLAIIVIIAAMLIDYFFFSDNSGESLVDKHTSLRTQNVVQDTIAPWAYKKINGY